MRFAVSEYVRWEDIDAAGIINYQAYLRFFGLAEVELFRSCGLSYKTLFDELGVWLPRVYVECDFFHPVRLDELLIVVTVPRGEFKPAPVPDAIRRKLESYLESGSISG